jgi:hypothetical protein
MGVECPNEDDRTVIGFNIDGCAGDRLKAPTKCDAVSAVPLPNRTTSAFDFRRRRSEYAPTEVAIKP